MKIVYALGLLLAVTGVASANLITNGDFTDDSQVVANTINAGSPALNQWMGSSTWDLTDGDDLSDAAQHGASTAPNAFGGGLVQVIPAPADGTELTLSFDYINSAGFGLDVHVFGMSSDAGFVGSQTNPNDSAALTSFLVTGEGLDGNDGDLDMPSTASDVFQSHVETGIVVSGGHDYLVVSFEFLGASAVSPAGVVQRAIDNVVLIPEPATMSLLALGGLALLRRRR